MSGTAVIVPIRQLETTKLRLSGLLSRSERASLSLGLLGRVLAAVEDSSATKCIVVASDPLELEEAKSYSKVKLLKETIHRGGVNSAMMDGLNFLRREDPIIAQVILLPSDLPFVTSAGIDSVIHLLSRYGAVIGSSRRKDGTTLLGFHFPRPLIPLHYDDNSFANHTRELQNLGLRYHILDADDKQFSFDVDNADDLREVFEKFRVKSAQELMENLTEEVSRDA